MKLLLFIFAVLILNSSLIAQCGIDDYGRMIPYAMCSKYKNLIDTSKVNTCHLKRYNNDSLFRAANKNIQGEAHIAGFTIDTLINLKMAATKYRIKEGTLWIYKIESKTAKRLGIKIDQLIIPEGAYLCLFPKQKWFTSDGSRTYTKSSIKDTKLWQQTLGNQLYIEYFEPNNVVKPASINLAGLVYFYS